MVFDKICGTLFFVVRETLIPDMLVLDALRWRRTLRFCPKTLYTCCHV